MKFYDREGRGHERVRQRQAWLSPAARKARLDARLSEKQTPDQLRERLSVSRRAVPVMCAPLPYSGALAEPLEASVLKELQRQRVRAMEEEMQQLEAERAKLARSIRLLELEFASVYRIAEHVKDIKDRVKTLEKKLKPKKKTRRKRKKRGR